MRLLGLVQAPLGRNDGAAAHVIGLFSAFQRAGVEMLCLAPSHLKPSRALPFRTVYVPTGPWGGAWTWLWHLLSPLWMLLYRIVFRPNVLYARGHLLLAQGALARLTGLPMAVEVNDEKAGELGWDGGLRARAATLARWTTWATYRLAHRILTVTPQLRDLAISEYGAQPARCRVVSNGFDPEVYYPRPRDAAKRELGLDAGRRYAIFVARLTRRHSLDLMLEGFKLFARSDGDMDLLVVGDGPARPELEEMVRQAGLGERVIWAGEVSHREVAVYVSASDVGISQLRVDRNARRVGASPLKVWAYLGCARPVIAGDVPNLAEMLREGDCGIVLKQESAEAFADALGWIASHPVEAEAMGRRGHELASSRYTWDAVARRTLEYLAEVSGGA